MTKLTTKLIEVALPLQAVNLACAREKSIRQGHPSTLHLWWARRPLAAARAVIFAQMVDDPSAHPDIFKTEEAQDKERLRLFNIIEELVLWESTNNQAVIQKAQDEIWKSWRYTCADNINHPRAKELFNQKSLPAFHDPFAGGGSLPLEAQRLGLKSYASDLNPVAVLINKAMVEIPPKFAGNPPVNPELEKNRDLAGSEWLGPQGLAEDVRYYGQWMREEAEKRIGHLYPKLEITPKVLEGRPDADKYADQKLTVIAWLWARTVKSPNPAFANVEVPLVSTFMLSKKTGNESYLEPVIEGDSYRFNVRVGKPDDAANVKRGTKLARANFTCLMSGAPISGDYIKAEGKAGRMGCRLLAIIANGDREQVYFAPTLEHEAAAQEAKPTWRPDGDIATRMTGGNCTPYGLTSWGDLFTPRQLVALTTFSDLTQDAHEQIKCDAIRAGMFDDGKALESAGAGARAYADSVALFLSLGVGRCANYWSSLTPWGGNFIVQTFGRQAIPMVWDHAEGNPFSSSTGNWTGALRWIEKVIVNALPASNDGVVIQADAQNQTISHDKVVSTDPPYYNNIGYADLSDFFYVWLRRSLRNTIPGIFDTLAVPKAEELVATPHRHGSKQNAEAFFLDGMTEAMHRLAEQAHPAFPVTIYYAFKQSETKADSGTASTGWETFLDAVMRAGFAVTGTWPMRTERDQGLKTGSNYLASSVLLVCRQRTATAPTATRREFMAALKAELPEALTYLQAGNIAPVDLAQAAIGPGMAVYTRYAQVLDAEGKPVSVRAALELINQTLDESLAEQEGDFDADTRWALTWFEQTGFDEGEYGVAEQLSKSKNTSVAGLVEAGILVSSAGKVRLLKPDELPTTWDPKTDSRLTVWEMVHHLIRVIEAEGEAAAATLVAKLGSKAETSRELCYRLFTLCERKKRANEAMAYNGLVQSWPEITRIAQETPAAAISGTDDLFDKE